MSTLIKCPTCGSDISSRAEFCPKCGDRGTVPGHFRALGARKALGLEGAPAAASGPAVKGTNRAFVWTIIFILAAGAMLFALIGYSTL